MTRRGARRRGQSPVAETGRSRRVKAGYTMAGVRCAWTRGSRQTPGAAVRSRSAAAAPLRRMVPRSNARLTAGARQVPDESGIPCALSHTMPACLRGRRQLLQAILPCSSGSRGSSAGSWVIDPSTCTSSAPGHWECSARPVTSMWLSSPRRLCLEPCALVCGRRWRKARFRIVSMWSISPRRTPPSVTASAVKASDGSAPAAPETRRTGGRDARGARRSRSAQQDRARCSHSALRVHVGGHMEGRPAFSFRGRRCRGGVAKIGGPRLPRGGSAEACLAAMKIRLPTGPPASG